MNAGTFNADVTVEAFADDGTLEDQVVLPANSINTVTLTGSIKTVTLIGGGGEGVLLNICADVA